MKLVIEINDYYSTKIEGLKYTLTSSIEKPEEDYSLMPQDAVNDSLARQIKRYAELKEKIKALLDNYYPILNSEDTSQSL